MCQGLAQEWAYGSEATGGVGLGQATAEMNAALAEASGTTIVPGPIPIEARILRDPDHLDKFNPTHWPEIREHWRRERLAGLNRVPVARHAVTFIIGGLLLMYVMPTRWDWIGLMGVMFGVTYWVAPWWWRN